MALKFHNTLSGKIEEFKPLRDKEVGMYNCGPTVYDYAHIGNMRAYVFADILKRVLGWNGYAVHQVMNITDVGHTVADADLGEDKIEKSAKEKQKTAKEIGDFYTKAFFENLAHLHVDTFRTIFPKATEHIPEQIALIDELTKRGFAYKTSDGIYFNTKLFPEYGKLGNINLAGLQEGERVEKNTEKKNPTDFALWKFSKPEEKRQQEWESRWGTGFPGWHVECSAMSMRYLGATFDIHTGGIDHIPVHHNNEIAQSEASTSQKYVHYWLHNNFLTVNGRKMSKSDGTFYTLHDLEQKNIHPLSFRYFLLGAHYSTPLNFTFEAIEGAQSTYEKILREVTEQRRKRAGHGNLIPEYMEKFTEHVNNDLDTPQGLATLHGLLEDKLYSLADKLETLLEFDKVLGLNLESNSKKMADIPQEILELHEDREVARMNKDFALSDKLRGEIESKGYVIRDFTKGGIIERKLSSLI